jgi:hypothetical protein
MESANQALDILRRHHAQISSLLDALHCGGIPSKDMVHELFIELRIHSILEQQLFYPAVSRLVTKNCWQSIEKEFYPILTLMLEVERVEAESLQFRDDVSAISERFAHHIHEQECDLFAQLDEGKAEADFVTLARRLEKCKADRRESMLALPGQTTRRSIGGGSFGIEHARCA